MESSPLHPTWLVDIQGRMMTRSMSSPERICEVMSSSCFFLVKQIREAQHFEHFGDLRSRLYSSSFHIYIYILTDYIFWIGDLSNNGTDLRTFGVTGHSAMAEFWWLLWCLEIPEWTDAVLEGCRIQVRFWKVPKLYMAMVCEKRIIHTWCKVCMDDIRSANWSYLVLLDPFVRCWTCCCIDASKCRSVFTRILHDRWLCNMLSICPRLAIKTGIRTRL